MDKQSAHHASTIADALEAIADDLEAKAMDRPKPWPLAVAETVELLRDNADQARRHPNTPISVINRLDGLRAMLASTRLLRLNEGGDRNAIRDLISELDTFTAGENFHVVLISHGTQHHEIVVRAQDRHTAAQRGLALDRRYLVSTEVPDAEILDLSSTAAEPEVERS
ncbi:hypothetical protein [Nocardia sp. NRRL S-836]|uniref:hypothetical protein n=1 Tax=Nocardia sp. NRRL S-836 TaxID=1519492 RepID=UPI0006C54524|nr:hypothetical protein [Nocardia sp. NRRL S-836]KOV81805.1 hypothetical protein ADL03_26860 [Nocardia sp. NRRL S-836]